MYSEETLVQTAKRLWKHWREKTTDASGDYGASALQSAVEVNDAAVIKELLLRGARDINAVTKLDGKADGLEYPLVVVVAWNGESDLVWIFLRRGAAQSREHKELLLRAATHSRSLELVQFLLEAGTDANGGIHFDGRYPDKPTPIVDAVEEHDLVMARLLLTHGARAGVSYEAGMSSTLTTAAGNGDLAMVKLLLRHGAPVDNGAKFGTALCFAVEEGHLAVAKTLIAAGANVNFSGYGGSVLTHAAYHEECPEWKRIQIVRLLVEKGAKVDALTKGEWTALLGAAYAGYGEVVKLLLDFGADVNHYDFRCSTALTLAVEENHLQVARLLLKRGARVRMNNCFGSGVQAPVNVDARKLAKSPKMKRLLQQYARQQGL